MTSDVGESDWSTLGRRGCSPSVQLCMFFVHFMNICTELFPGPPASQPQHKFQRPI